MLRKIFLDQIINHCKEEYPQEACGILAGSDGGVSKVYKMTNTDKSSITFFMDAREQFAAVRDMRTRGLEIAAIYHSHPHSSAYPSPRDVKLAFYPEAVYIIISLADLYAPEVRAFRIEDGKVYEESLKIQKGRGVKIGD